MTKINWARQYAICLIPFAMYMIGRELEYMETERMSRYRDKSALYGKILAPGEPPSWPVRTFP